MKLSILAAAAAISLAACTTPSIPSVPTTPSPPSGESRVGAVAQKALYAAETLYNVPAQAYVTLNRAGRLTPEQKAKARPALLQAYQALKLARQAAAAGDEAGLMLQIAQSQKFLAVASAILPKE